MTEILTVKPVVWYRNGKIFTFIQTLRIPIEYWTTSSAAISRLLLDSVSLVNLCKSGRRRMKVSSGSVRQKPGKRQYQHIGLRAFRQSSSQ
jgi:hypothetical protein